MGGFLILLWATMAHAATVVVDQTGGADALSIAEGLELLQEGDTLHITAGTYFETWLDQPVDDVTIEGEGADVTIIDGSLEGGTDDALGLFGTVAISDLTFVSHGYGIWFHGDDDDSTGLGVIERCRFVDIAGWGVVTRSYFDTLYVLDSEFSGMYAGIADSYHAASDLHIENNVFTGNDWGVQLEYEPAHPGTVHHVLHNTFVDNSIAIGWGYSYGGRAEITIANNLIHSGARGYQFNGDWADAEFAYNLVGTEVVDLYAVGDPIADSHDNVTADPMLCGYDPKLSWQDWDLRPMPGSPAVDMGSDAYGAVQKLDLGGSARPKDGDGDGVALPDAGAYEYDPANSCVEDTGDSVDTGDTDGPGDSGDSTPPVDSGESAPPSDSADTQDSRPPPGDTETPADSEPSDTGEPSDGCRAGCAQGAAGAAPALAWLALLLPGLVVRSHSSLPLRSHPSFPVDQPG